MTWLDSPLPGRQTSGRVAVLAVGLLTAACGDGEVPREQSLPGSVGDGPGGAAPASAGAADGATSNATVIDADGVLVLDDLSDGDSVFRAGSISGEWFTYSDGTSEVSPPDHTGLGSIAGEAHVTGEGFSEWGVGLSAYFGSADLSEFSRLVLRLRGSGSLVVELATVGSSPPGEGGTCEGAGCFGHYSARLELGPDYEDHSLDFAELYQPGWAQPVDLMLGSVISINLLSPSAGGVAAIDLWLDAVSVHVTASSP